MTDMFKHIQYEYINGIDENGVRIFPTLKDLSKKYNIELNIIKDFINSQENIEKERDMNIDSFKNELVLSTPEGVVKHIDDVLSNFLNLGRETMDALKYQLLTSIQEGDSKSADGWSKVIDRYINMMYNMKREKQLELIKQDESKYSNEDSGISKRLLLMVEEVVKQKIKDPKFIDVDYKKD